MSRWETTSTAAPGPGWDSGWGNGAAPSASPGKTSDDNAFDTTNMSAALPDVNNVNTQASSHAVNKSNGDSQSGDTKPGDAAAAHGWVPPKEYDYGEYVTPGGEFEGNVTVYHWDGEEGDIGPEFPQLEAELFGPPDRRELPQGIDFTRWVFSFKALDYVLY